MTEVYIGLGSNIDRPVERVKRALAELAGLPSTRIIRHSALYLTAPDGPRNQPDYVNAVAALNTALSPIAMLNHLQRLERRQGRVRRLRWGPRTLDLDLLLFGRITVNHPRLVVPHPLLHRRAFVLIPLSDLDTDLLIPGKGPVHRLVARLSRSERSAARKIHSPG